MASPQPVSEGYFCTACKSPFANRFPLDQHGVCAACRQGLRGFDEAMTFGFYEGNLRSLIHLFKYAGMKPLAQPLASLLLRALPIDRGYDLIVPVPLHWKKRWQRGYNQSELLARQIATRRSIPLLHALRRRRQTEVQAGLALAGRRRNVAGAFTLRGRLDLKGKRVLLIDDVMTTGATAGACAAVLKRGGAGSVALLTLARADRR